MVQIFLNHKKEFNTVTVKQAKFIVLDVFFFFFLRKKGTQLNNTSGGIWKIINEDRENFFIN